VKPPSLPREVGAHIAAAPRQTDFAATPLFWAVLAAKGVFIEEVLMLW